MSENKNIKKEKWDVIESIPLKKLTNELSKVGGDIHTTVDIDPNSSTFGELHTTLRIPGNRDSHF
jgi:hypothetical protein